MLDDARPRLNGAVRQLFARIAPGAARIPEPRPGVWETGHGEAGDIDAPTPETARRAQAHAAFRAAGGSDDAALDAALAVVEDEAARLRRTVRAYGAALREIEVHGRDAGARGTAAAALRRTPEHLHGFLPRPRPSKGHRLG
jgi:hypothetical protein